MIARIWHPSIQLQNINTHFLISWEYNVTYLVTNQYKNTNHQYLYIIRCLLLKYRLIFFMSLESIWRAFRRVKYRKTSKNISRYFKRRHLIIYLLSNSKNFTPGVKILEFKFNRRHQDFPKSKIYTNHSNQNIFGGGGGNFLGVQFFGLPKC